MVHSAVASDAASHVWFSQLLHFAYLVGLAIGWKWPRLGGFVSITIAAIFLADKNLSLLLPTIFPGVPYLISGCLDRPQRLHLAV